ncbi:MAG: hypothetical protein ACI8SR_003451 [Oceanicoccus sp.]|jgi:hypothetical protein
MLETHNKNIKLAPCGRPTLRAVYIGRYVNKEGRYLIEYAMVF